MPRAAFLSAIFSWGCSFRHLWPFLYSYTKSRPDPTQCVKDAVAAVFDRGETVVDEPILYFYNPALVTSDFHESQIFVIEEGGHRFFAERSTR